MNDRHLSSLDVSGTSSVSYRKCEEESLSFITKRLKIVETCSSIESETNSTFDFRNKEYIIVALAIHAICTRFFFLSSFELQLNEKCRNKCTFLRQVINFFKGYKSAIVFAIHILFLNPILQLHFYRRNRIFTSVPLVKS